MGPCISTLGVKEQRVIDQLVTALGKNSYVPMQGRKRSYDHESVEKTIELGLAEYHLDMTKADQYFDVQVAVDAPGRTDATHYTIVISAGVDMHGLFEPLVDEVDGLVAGSGIYTAGSFRKALHLSQPAKAEVEKISQSLIQVISGAYKRINDVGIVERPGISKSS